MLTWENTWQDIEKIRPTPAVVPIGATEQHGTNLPPATGSLLTWHIAEAIARRCGAYLVPMLPFGQSDDSFGRPSKGTRGQGDAAWKVLIESTLDRVLKQWAAASPG